MGLAEGIQLEAAVLRSRLGQDRERAVVKDEAVGIVITYEDAVPAAEVHESGIEFLGSCGACRHVRVVGPHDLDSAEVHLLERFEIRPPSVFLAEIVCDDFSFDQSRCRRISRISRVRHQDLVAFVQECERDQQDSFLRSHQRLDFSLGVQLHSIPAGIPIREGLPELRKPHIALISMITSLLRAFTQGLDRLHWRHSVRRADTQIDYRFFAADRTLGIHCRYFLEFARKVVFLHTFRPFCRSYHHNIIHLWHFPGGRVV